MMINYCLINRVNSWTNTKIGLKQDSIQVEKKGGNTIFYWNKNQEDSTHRCTDTTYQETLSLFV